jgi:alkanesulfonate monooxygenase SsuD/methylene tetrahydromethanopterin reductase-like flavin-dependent oxidoreductase (luciferase family)
MRFGWLTLAHSPGPEQDYTAIGEQLEQACLADALGFDGVWLTEHNFTGEAVYSDPIPFASALAVRTRRVRIGFAVIQLALRHPVRLAVQLALLDNLCGGRLDVGVGRGSIYNEYEFVGYGLRSDDARERSAEALEVLTRAWTEAPFEYHGKYFDLSMPALRPRCVQHPHPPIWRSVVTPPSFRECGRLGLPIMTPRVPLARLPERLALYAQGLVEGGHDAATCARLREQVAVWRHVYVGRSRAEAEDTLGAAVLHTREHMIHARTAYNPPDFHVDPGFMNPFTDPAVSHADGVKWSLETGALYGTAAEVAEQVAAHREAGVEHLLCQLSFGYLPHEKITASMQRFAEDVMPRFRKSS